MLKGCAEASLKKTELGREKVICKTDGAHGRQAEGSPGGQEGWVAAGQGSREEFTGEEGHQGSGEGASYCFGNKTKNSTWEAVWGKESVLFPKSHQD